MLVYHYQTLECVIVRFLNFVCNFLHRLGLIQGSKYPSNLSLRFGGVGLNSMRGTIHDKGRYQLNPLPSRKS